MSETKTTSGDRPSGPTREQMMQGNVGKPLRLALWFARAYPGRGLVTMGCLILSGVFEGLGLAAMLPLLNLVFDTDSGSQTRVGQFIEQGFAFFGQEPSIPALLVFFVVVIWLKSMLVMAAISQAGFSAAHVTKNLRLELLRSLANARWSYFTGERMGNFTAALSGEAGKASGAFLQLVRMLADFLQIVAYVVLAIFISGWVTIAAVAVGAVTIVLLSRLVTMAREAGRAQSLLIRGFTGRLIDGLTTIKPIKAMGQERQLLPLLENDVEALNAVQRRVILSREALKSLHEPILVVAVAIGLYFMVDVWRGELEGLFAIIILFHRTVTRINSLQTSYQGLVRNEAGFWFVQSLITAAKAAMEGSDGGRQPTLRRDIKFVGVSISYGDKAVLTNVSLTIPAGGFVTITGPSGAGKTTSADLIIGLLRPSSGRILVDGVPLDDLDMRAWRQTIGYVPQETLLFHDTIYANVTLGDTTIERERADESLRRAGAWEFVAALPAGIDTIVGERGLKFSGGQRQRIAIARALIRNPKLLILDEATTSLDPESEASICSTLDALVGEITILAISHQPALVEAATTVYRIKDGGASTLSGDPSSPMRANAATT